MKKIFLIPLLALFTCATAWAVNEAKIGDTEYATLKEAIDAASSGATIELLADVHYVNTDGSAQLNINKSLTIDGKNHTISGYSARSNGHHQNATIWINLDQLTQPTSPIDVTFKYVTIKNEITGNKTAYAIQSRRKLGSLTLDHVTLEATKSGKNPTALQYGGNQYGTKATITIKDSHLIAGDNGYCLLSWNAYNSTITNTVFDGWAGLYFKGVDGSDGSRGSNVSLTACEVNCTNIHSGRSNAFGVFVCEDDGITITANNCKLNSSAHGDQAQALLIASAYYMGNDRRTQPISLTLEGDNTRIIMDGFFYNNIDVKAVETFNNNSWYNKQYDPKGALDSDSYVVPFSVTITGGTYDVNPYYYRHVIKVNRDEEGKPIETEDGYSVVTQSPIIPEGYGVIEVQDGDKILYRVKSSENVSYDINGSYEEGEEGENPTTSFIVTAEHSEDPEEELKPIELSNDSTVAAYVQVRDNEAGDATVLLVGKVVEEEKVDQKLVVNNGLDVQGESQVVVQTGSTLQIGEGGIVTAKPENIVIEANEDGAASLIMDPAITVNQTPNLTVKMKAKLIGWMDVAGEKNYFWHRFALPIQEADSWVKDPNKGTYVFGWNYSANDWEQLSALTQMEPFRGYTLTADYENLGDIEYTFTGRLAGNTNNLLKFERNGFNFFGNSYTGYIDVLALVEQILGDSKIDGTVWMWHQNTQTYVAVPLQSLREDSTAFDPWQREVAPMQTFILKQNGGENATAELDYASAIWGNPRYGNNVNTSAPIQAPRRQAANDITRMRIVVTAENGKSDFVMLTEATKFSDEFEKGYDGEKFTNENALNMYTTVNGTDFTAVATDNLEGKTVTIKTVESVNYTMSFAKVAGEEFAILDNATNEVVAIEEGNTYEFAAQPNSTIEGRFEIISRAKMPTAIENTEVKADVKGIYTIMGQYLGENFEALPAGVYVVNGVKIVK